MNLYDFTPDQHEAIAKVESLRAMRVIKVGYRNHFRSMPAVTAYIPSRLLALGLWRLAPIIHWRKPHDFSHRKDAS